MCVYLLQHITFNHEQHIFTVETHSFVPIQSAELATHVKELSELKHIKQESIT